MLKDAGLVVDRAEANRRIYAVDPDGLRDLHAFLEGFWADALSRFTEVAESGDR